MPWVGTPCGEVGRSRWTICCRCPWRRVCLHLPSFVLCAIGLWHLPAGSATAAGRLRAAAWGLALAGVLGVLRLDEALLALGSGSAWSGALWQENPLALFAFLTDATLALLMMGPGGPVPALHRDRLRWLLRLGPGVGVLVLAWQTAPATRRVLAGRRTSRAGPG